MLFGYVFTPYLSSVTKSGPFTLISSGYNSLFSNGPGKTTTFVQTGSVSSQTLTLTFNFPAAFANDLDLPYPCLVMGVVNIGNYRFAGQLTPTVTFKPNGKWGANTKTSAAAIVCSGYSSAWAVVPRSQLSGSAQTTQLIVTLTGTFNSGVQATFGQFGIGSIVICGADELPLSDLSIKPMMDTGMSESSQGARVLRPAYRIASGNVTPQLRADSFGYAVPSINARTYQDQIFYALQSRFAAVAPFWRDPGTAGPNIAMLNENAILSEIVSLPSISGSANDNRFRGGYGFKEVIGK